jgi:hypothetical protein
MLHLSSPFSCSLFFGRKFFSPALGGEMGEVPHPPVLAASTVPSNLTMSLTGSRYDPFL